MNNLRNKVNLIGRLGVQPETMEFETGRKLVRFSLATNDRYKNKNGEWQEDVQWHNVTVWGKVADRAEKMLEKGQEILLEGKISYQSYENQQGEKRYSTVIEGNDFMLLNKPSGEVKA
jgi:single-strand DNA-binding protein